VDLLLPIWLERDVGKWSVFGGGGYQVNPGEGNRNFWSGGLAVTRQMTNRLNLGAEITYQTADACDGRNFAGANLGVIYKLTSHWSLLAAGGRASRTPARVASTLSTPRSRPTY
jgi:hypothetical protein